MGEKIKPRQQIRRRKGKDHESVEVFNELHAPTPEEIQRQYERLTSEIKEALQPEVHSVEGPTDRRGVYDDSMSNESGETPPRINSFTEADLKLERAVEFKFPTMGIDLSGPSHKAKAWENIIVKQVQSALYALGKPRAVVNSFVKKSIIAPLQAGSLPTVQQSLMGLEALLKNKNIVIPVEKIKVSQEKPPQEPVVAEDSSLTQEEAFEILTGYLKASEVVKHNVDFNYPTLGITYQGPLTHEVLENEIIPRVKESLNARGLTDIQVVERLINNSLRQQDDKGRHLKGLPLEDVLKNYESGYARWKEVNVQEEQDKIEQGTVDPVPHSVENAELIENAKGRIEVLENRVDSLEGKVEGESSLQTPAPLSKAEASKTPTELTPGLTKSKNQLSWLTKRTGTLSNERGVKVKDALATDSHFKIIRDDIHKLKYRLTLLDKGKQTEKTKAEIKQLRHELAEELLILQFREHKNVILRYPTLGINYEGPVPDVEGIENAVLPHLVETLKKHDLSETEARLIAENQIAPILKINDPAERTVVLRRYLIDFTNKEEARKQNFHLPVTPPPINETSSTVEMTTGVEEAVPPIHVDLEIAPRMGEIGHTHPTENIEMNSLRVTEGYNTMSSEEAEATLSRGIEAALNADPDHGVTTNEGLSAEEASTPEMKEAEPKEFNAEKRTTQAEIERLKRLRKLEKKSPKIHENKEDQARQYVPIENGEHDADYVRKERQRRVNASAHATVGAALEGHVPPPPTIDTSALERRLEYYKNDTKEDPKVREHLIANLEMRIQRMKNVQGMENTSSGNNVVTAESMTGLPKTGWWNQKFRDGKMGYNTMPSEEVNASAYAAVEAALLAEQHSVEPHTEQEPLGEQQSEAISAIPPLSPTEQLPEQKPEPDPEPTLQPPSQPEPLAEPLPVPPSPEPEPTPVQLKAYQERLVIRNVWKEKKTAYEAAYKDHLVRRANRSIFRKIFGKKEEKPVALETLEKEYQDARRVYAKSLNSALRERVNLDGVALASSEGEMPEKQLLDLRAGLANRFVLQAAHAKLALEKEYIPEGRASRIFDSTQGFMKKRGTYLALGIATVTGSVMGIGATAIGYASPKAGAIIGTATAGAALGAGFLYNKLLLNKRESRRDNAVSHTRQKFSIGNIEKDENDYLEKYRSYEKALRNKKYVVAASGLAAGLATAGILGGLGSDYGTETPQPFNSDTPLPNLPPVEASAWDLPSGEGPGFVTPESSSPVNTPEVVENEQPIQENVPAEKPTPEYVPIDKPVYEAPPVEKPLYETPINAPEENLPPSPAYEQAQPQEEIRYHQEEDLINHDPEEEQVEDSVRPENGASSIVTPLLGEYTVQAGDNFWNIAEGQTNAEQPPVFKEVPPDRLQATIDLTRDYLNEHPLIAQEAGFPVAGNIATVHPGNTLNLDLINEIARDIAIDNGFISR